MPRCYGAAGGLSRRQRRWRRGQRVSAGPHHSVSPARPARQARSRRCPTVIRVIVIISDSDHVRATRSQGPACRGAACCNFDFCGPFTHAGPARPRPASCRHFRTAAASTVTGMPVLQVALRRHDIIVCTIPFVPVISESYHYEIINAGVTVTVYGLKVENIRVGAPPCTQAPPA